MLRYIKRVRHFPKMTNFSSNVDKVTDYFIRNDLLVSTAISVPVFSIIKRNFSGINDTDSDSDSEIYDSTDKLNPSVEVQRRIQQDAQKKLDDILANDPEKSKLYKILQLEIDVLRQSNMKVPTKLRATEWLQILEMKTTSPRRKYLGFLFSVEMKKKKRETKKISSTQEDNSREERDITKYGLRNNTMFIRISQSKMSQTLNEKLIRAMIFGEKVIMDCGFESHMNHRELSSCAKQLMFAFVANREDKDPFDLYLCNLDPEGELKRRLISFFPTMDDPSYPMNTTSKSYLELFPKNNLVYLTPHTNNILQSYNPDDIYIIGAIVDKRDSKPLTVAKAKEEGLRVAKFPLDHYLDWKSGSGKSLNLNHCMEILLDLKETNNWEQALKVVPSRKVIKPYIEFEDQTRVYNPFKNYEPKFRSLEATHMPVRNSIK